MPFIGLIVIHMDILLMCFQIFEIQEKFNITNIILGKLWSIIVYEIGVPLKGVPLKESLNCASRHQQLESLLSRNARFQRFRTQNQLDVFVFIISFELWRSDKSYRYFVQNIDPRKYGEKISSHNIVLSETLYPLKRIHHSSCSKVKKFRRNTF